MAEARSIAQAEIPRLRDGIDLTRAGLSLEEGFLVSRVDGRTAVPELALLINKSVDETRQLVERLTNAGVLVLGDEDAREPEVLYSDFPFPPGAMEEDVDLTEDERRKILFTHAHLGQWTHYELLGIRWRDDAKTIKRAYFERSKEWHPDRFRRGRLGSFKARIDNIFRSVRDAYSVLSKPEDKAKYDEEHAPRFDEEDMAAMLAAQRREQRTSQREEEQKRRRLDRNPMRQRIQRAKALYEEALGLQEKGELMEALRSAQAAAAIHDCEEHRGLKRELQMATAELRIAPLVRRGLHAESMTSWDDAVTVFAEAVRLAPEYGPARLRLAYNMAMGGRPPQLINEHIQRALQLMPDEPEAHFVRGLCYEKGDMGKAAIRAYQRAVELKPNYAEAKKRLKKLRWGF